MKTIYVSPVIEIRNFTSEDILTTSSISFDGFNYDVVSSGISVDGNGAQNVDATMSGTEFFSE